MQDYAFDIVRVRGLGKSPTPPPPPPLVQDQGSVAGVGQDPASVREPEGVGLEPEGVGQGQPALPPGIQIVGPQTQCKHWILAFVVGAKMANVLLHDGAGFDHQLVANLLAPGQKPVFFTFAGTEGTYLFAYETVNGRHVIKMCVDGMTLHHTPQSRVPWTVSKHPAAKMTGLGAVFKTAPAYIGSGVTSGGNVQIDPINRSVGGKWATLGTIDSSGNFNASDPTGQLTKASDLQSTLNNWASNIQQVGGTAPKVGGFSTSAFRTRTAAQRRRRENRPEWPSCATTAAGSTCSSARRAGWRPLLVLLRGFRLRTRTSRAAPCTRLRWACLTVFSRRLGRGYGARA